MYVSEVYLAYGSSGNEQCLATKDVWEGESTPNFRLNFKYFGAQICEGCRRPAGGCPMGNVSRKMAIQLVNGSRGKQFSAQVAKCKDLVLDWFAGARVGSENE